MPRLAQSQSSTCVLWNIPELVGFSSYVLFPPSNFLRGDIPTYSDSSCTNSTGTVTSNFDALVYAPDAPNDIYNPNALRICNANLPGTNTATFLLISYLFWCTNTPPAASVRPRSKPFVPRPTLATGEVLNQTELEIRAFDGFYSGIQFQRIYAEHVGYKYVNELGFLDGVDAWSNIGKGYEVCFPQAGVILFADAANAPRVLEEIDYYSRHHYTCASETRAGTMFLVETNPSP